MGGGVGRGGSAQEEKTLPRRSPLASSCFRCRWLCLWRRLRPCERAGSVLLGRDSLSAALCGESFCVVALALGSHCAAFFGASFFRVPSLLGRCPPSFLAIHPAACFCRRLSAGRSRIPCRSRGRGLGLHSSLARHIQRPLQLSPTAPRERSSPTRHMHQ